MTSTGNTARLNNKTLPMVRLAHAGDNDSWRDDLFRQTAQRIVDINVEWTDRLNADPNVEIVYPDAERPPTTVEEIEAELREGKFWISWLDKGVTTNMAMLGFRLG